MDKKNLAEHLESKNKLEDENKAFKRVRELFDRNINEALQNKKGLINNDKLTKILIDENFIISAYDKLKSNKGSMTAGVDLKDTAERLTKEKVVTIAKDIKEGKYIWKAIRREYIPKPGKKTLRPLGIPVFTDRIVQEMIRVVLNVIFEPTFQLLECNHGFRPNRSTTTAIQTIKDNAQGMTTAIEGDIKGAYDNVNKKILMNLLRKRITDEKFLKLVSDGLDAGINYEGKIYHNLTGVPQGGICSPILFNIYMEPFDIAVIDIMTQHLKEINLKEKRTSSPEGKRYAKANTLVESSRNSINNNYKNKRKRSPDIQKAKHKKLVKILKQRISARRKIKRLDQSKRILFFSYTRYADDFLILTNASEKECAIIKDKIKKWLETNLKLELSEDKTLITKLIEKPAKFLGFTIYQPKTLRVVKVKKKLQSVKQRINLGPQIGLDMERIKDRLRNEGMIRIKRIKGKNITMPCHIKRYTSQKKFDIVERYKQKITGLINYYYHNITIKSKLIQFYYYHRYSLLMTLGFMEKQSIVKISKKYGPNIEMTRNIKRLNTKGKKMETVQKIQFPKYSMLMKWASELSIKKTRERIINRVEKTSLLSKIGIDDIYKNIKTEVDPFRITNFRTRTAYQLTQYCVICGTKPSVHNKLETHHIKHLKKAKMNTFGEIMQALNSKTIVCCKRCHRKIHNGLYDGIALSEIYDQELITLNKGWNNRRKAPNKEE